MEHFSIKNGYNLISKYLQPSEIIKFINIIEKIYILRFEQSDLTYIGHKSNSFTHTIYFNKYYSITKYYNDAIGIIITTLYYGNIIIFIEKESVNYKLIKLLKSLPKQENQYMASKNTLDRIFENNDIIRNILSYNNIKFDKIYNLYKNIYINYRIDLDGYKETIDILFKHNSGFRIIITYPNNVWENNIIYYDAFIKGKLIDHYQNKITRQ